VAVSLRTERGWAKKSSNPHFQWAERARDSFSPLCPERKSFNQEKDTKPGTKKNFEGGSAFIREKATRPVKGSTFKLAIRGKGVQGRLKHRFFQQSANSARDLVVGTS